MSARQTPEVTYYDLLHVEPSASAAEIRAAWKAAIADLDPTDRRFRVSNEAAGVLLDPVARTAYDDEIGPVVTVGEGSGEDLVADGDVDAPVAVAPVEDVPDSREGPSGADRGRRPVPGWLLVGLAAATAVMVAVSGWLWFKVPSDAAVESATREAQSAGSQAVEAILAYDYRHMAADQARADAFMTPGQRAEYDKLFAVLEQNAPQTQAVVQAQVQDAGVVDVTGDDEVRILYFVKRPTTNKQVRTPIPYLDQVTVTMRKEGGDWLVDDLITWPALG